MSETSTTQSHAQLGRLLHDIGLLAPAFAGAVLWLVVGLKVDPIQKDVAEIKADVDTMAENVATLREDVARIGGILESRFKGVSFEPTDGVQQPPIGSADFDIERSIVYTDNKQSPRRD